MRPLNLIAVTLLFVPVTLASVSAGQEMPMYQMPQANQMQTLPPPALKPRDVACTPATTPVPQGTTNVATADATVSQTPYHVVDGKCVPVGGN
jgi:hypothetical protein